MWVYSSKMQKAALPPCVSPFLCAPFKRTSSLVRGLWLTASHSGRWVSVPRRQMSPWKSHAVSEDVTETMWTPKKEEEPWVSEVSTDPSFPPPPAKLDLLKLCFCSPSIRNQDSLLYTTREKPTAENPDYGRMSLLCLTQEHSLRRAVGTRRARRRRKEETPVTEVSSNCCKWINAEKCISALSDRKGVCWTESMQSSRLDF